MRTMGMATWIATVGGLGRLFWPGMWGSVVGVGYGVLLVRTLPGHVVYAAAAGAHFARAGLLGTFVRAKVAALAGMGRVLKKRAQVQRTRRVGASAIWPLLESRWLSAKIREKRFDLGMAGER